MTSASENRGKKEGRRSGTVSALTCGPHMSVAETKKKTARAGLWLNGLSGLLRARREREGLVGWASWLAWHSFFLK